MKVKKIHFEKGILRGSFETERDFEETRELIFTTCLLFNEMPESYYSHISKEVIHVDDERFFNLLVMYDDSTLKEILTAAFDSLLSHRLTEKLNTHNRNVDEVKKFCDKYMISKYGY